MMEYSDSVSLRKYVKENREELMKLVRHGDPFIRTLGLAALLEGGDKVDLKMAKRELELIEEIEGEYDDLY